MDTSIFEDKNIVPTENDLISALGEQYVLWKTIHEYVYLKYPMAMDEWKHSGVKYGWSFRVKDKKRVIVYLMPRDHFFKVAMVFGQKAFEEVMKANISQEIKDMLAAAVVYAEGRGIRIEVRDESMFKDVRKLIDIKIS